MKMIYRVIDRNLSYLKIKLYLDVFQLGWMLRKSWRRLKFSSKCYFIEYIGGMKYNYSMKMII